MTVTENGKVKIDISKTGQSFEHLDDNMKVYIQGVIDGAKLAQTSQKKGEEENGTSNVPAREEPSSS